MGNDLSDPAVFGRAYDEHSRSVYTAAYRIVGNQAQAQDVVQDVFLRIWRRPRTFDAGRGELGSYLRMMARSRALDLWREGQAAGRASDRLKLTVAQEPREQERPDAGADASAALAGRRDVWLAEAGGFVSCPIYDRERLDAGNRFAGPAIVEQMDSTTVVLPGMTARVEPYLNLILEAQ